ncbi:DUF222 domain-containing protein [Ilumatobacter sp.]|uniref:HNH endonuclease signature motif containing protein n=1 Tax=Ilumatobacter sp. TaxID=1967498 RepID=UPI003C48F0C9
MDTTVLSECVEELSRYHAPTPDVAASTRLVRRARAAQLDEVGIAVDAGSFFGLGFRSPTDWLTTTTREGVGACRTTLHLADRIRKMPVVREAFGAGDLAETALRLLAEAWHADIADAFARDEQMLCGWATSLSHKDFKFVLDTWRLHADPDRADRSEQERYDARALHLSSMLDAMGRIDGMLDPEGFALVREAIRALSQAAADDTRSAAQRRSDGLVAMARMALERVDPVPGRKRRKPKVVATISYDDLVAATGGGSLETDIDRSMLSTDAIRRIACDCTVNRLITGPQSTILDFGRTQRVVSDRLFDVLALRDHGCRFAGCTVPASGCDAHHAIHWVDGGATEPDNLPLVCWHHHHWLHEQHWSIEPLGGGHFILIDPDGGAHTMRPPMVGPAPT